MKRKGVVVREERMEDLVQIHAVNHAAFEHPDEAELVDQLRRDGDVLLSMVADIGGSIVGHILFSRMSIETATGPYAAVALAPMAVLPGYQKQGIGGELIRHGIAELRGRGERVVLVLGHVDYYPRFGFSSGATRELSHPFPPEAYMGMELVPGALEDLAGAVRYPAAFGIV